MITQKGIVFVLIQTLVEYQYKVGHGLGISIAEIILHDLVQNWPTVALS